MSKPDKYQQAKQVLSGFGFDIEELRKRMALAHGGKINKPTPIALNDAPQNNQPSQNTLPQQGKQHRWSNFVDPRFKIDF